MPRNTTDNDKDDSAVLLLHVRGFPFPGSRWFYKEIIEEALDLQPRDTDILISSFPKCGTNWMKYIVWSIITKGTKPLTSSHQLTYEAVPFLDISGVQAAEALDDPRALHYHLPYYMIPKNPNAKYIYIFRNPKDVVVSFYHFTMQTDQMSITFDEYFETFMRGLTAYGDFFEHVLSWYEHKDKNNVLFISYEEIHKDTEFQLLRIAKFIGQEYHDCLAQDKELLQTVLRRISFDDMKKTLMKSPENAAELKNDYFLESNVIQVPFQVRGSRYGVECLKYYRKGVVGDWKNHLSVEQSTRLSQRMEQMFGETGIMKMLDSNNNL